MVLAAPGCCVIITDNPVTASLNHACAGVVMDDMRSSSETSEGTESSAPAPPSGLQKKERFPDILGSSCKAWEQSGVSCHYSGVD